MIWGLSSFSNVTSRISASNSRGLILGLRSFMARLISSNAGGAIFISVWCSIF